MSSNSFSSNNSFSTLDHLPPSEQLCYVHCNICDTVLAVSVPCTSLFKTVTVRCGHCTNLLPVNMRGLIFHQSSTNYHHPHLNLAQSFFSPPPPAPPPPAPPSPPNHLEEIQNPTAPNYLMNQINGNPNNDFNSINPINGGIRVGDLRRELPRPPAMNRPPEKRQRVPSAYNRFIKDEIQRIKAGNPDISHREAFSAAAKNWAHFPHIHFGLLPDQTIKKTNTRQQEEGDHHVLMKDGLFAAAANV